MVFTHKMLSHRFSYHFDHGHNHHLDVSPEWKEAYMKRIADR